MRDFRDPLGFRQGRLAARRARTSALFERVCVAAARGRRVSMFAVTASPVLGLISMTKY